MESYRFGLGVVIVLLVLVAVSVQAGAPRLVNYQGILTDAGGALLDGDYDLDFKIYADSSGGSPLWTEAHSDVGIDDGLFNVVLGRTSAIFDSLFDEAQLWMGITVDTDPEIDPRMRMTSVPWAFKAIKSDSAGTVLWGNIAAIPAGFADGVDNVGPGDGHSLDADDGVPFDAVYVDSAGWVGIGTTVPASYLEVENHSDSPDIRLDASTDGSAYLRFSQDNDQKAFVRINSSGDLQLDTDASGMEAMTILNSNAYVGVGTTSPLSKLDVAGTVEMTGFKMPTGAAANRVLTSDGSGNGTWQPVSPDDGDWTINGSNIYSAVSGNVGVGTSSPSYKLHVNGNLYATTVNTGNGNYELYAMDQNVRTGDSPTFATVNTGLGNNELYSMNQHVRTSDNVTFATINTGYGANELYDMNQHVTPSSNVTFATVNTGLGANELYDMNQNVMTGSNVTFNRVSISDYGTALGGFHVGGTSDPGTDNLVVDGSISANGTVTATGGLSTGESPSGEVVRFGTKTTIMADCNPIVTCRSGYFWWDYSERKLKFTETNAHNGYARFSGQKNEGAGPVLFDGTASYEGTSTVATLNSNLEYATVEVTSEGSNGGYIHLYCMQSNLTFVAHYWFRYQ